MTRPRMYLTACLLGAGLLSACGGDDGKPEPAWVWDLPFMFPEPRVPEDNPMSASKVELGRHLFYDKRLSKNETQSCASCHQQSRAFTDGMALAEGSTGQTHPRGSMSLGNVAYNKTFLWANPTVTHLEEQAVLPIFGEEPIVELGFAGKEETLLKRLRDDADVAERFHDAFPGEADPVTVANIARALASFQRTMITGQSAYDRWLSGEDEDALSASAKRGMDLFFEEKFECFHCHGSFNFAASVDHKFQALEEAKFENNGLYDVDGRGAYPAANQGLYEFTNLDQDQGKFKPPSLRNIAKTAPYMHDGSIATLSEVIDHYAAGGRNVVSGPNVGDGRLNPNKNLFVSGFEATAQEKADILAFLDALTDDAFLTNPALSDPAEDESADE